MIRLLLKHWPIILLLVLTFLLRIYKLEEFFYFSYDEEIPAFVARKLLLFGDISLLGGITPFGFHLGPYFYWLLALLLFFSGLDPIIWGFAGAIGAVVTTFMMFLVGKEFFNKRVGFLAAGFWTFSYTANLSDRHFWALYWGLLISLLVLYSLYKIIKGQQKFVFPLVLSLAFGIHTDPSNLVFLILTITIWIIYKIPINRSTIIAASIVILSFLPLAVFDVRHNFANSKPVLDFIKQGRNVTGIEVEKVINNSLIFPQAFTRLIYAFGDSEIAKQYSYCQNFVAEKNLAIPSIFVLIASVLLTSFVWLGVKKKKDFLGFYLISILILLYFLGIQVYGTIFRADVFEHYLTGLFAVFLLIFAKGVSLLPKRTWLIIVAIFVFINLYKLSNAKNSHGLKYKKQAIEYTMQQIGDKPFSLDSLSTCWKYSGYRYLFAVFVREPVKSYVDPNLAHLYGPTKVASEHPETVVAFITHDFVPETDDFYKRYAFLKAHEVESNIFGNIEVIILNNSNKWFY